jgi:hypothetical protein
MPAPVDVQPSQQDAPSIRFKGKAVSVEAKRAYATKACADLCAAETGTCECEASQERADWIFLRMRRSLQAGVSWSWFVLKLGKPGYELLAEHSDAAPLPPGASLVERYELCRTHTDTMTPPAGSGVIEVAVFEEMIPDEDFDHPMLVLYFDCKQTTSSGVEHFAYRCSTNTYDCFRVPAADAKERASWGMSEAERQEYLERRLDPDRSRGGRECDEDDDSEDCEAFRRFVEEELQ